MARIGCANYRRAVSRRTFLNVGLGGLSLPAILRARTLTAETGGVNGQLPPDTAVIQYWLGGAASHIETYDPKPDAPADFRGPFHPISTNVPGVQICETLPETGTSTTSACNSWHIKKTNLHPDGTELPISTFAKQSS